MRGSTTRNPGAWRGPGRTWPGLATPAILLALAGAVAGAGAGGCGSRTSSGYSVSGTVTWHGQPLDQGSIQFLPEGGPGQLVGAGISNGHYVLPNPPGLAAGTYRVRINSLSGVSPAAIPDMHLGHPGSKERIPPEYNEKTTLKAEVTGSGSKMLDFTLK